MPRNPFENNQSTLNPDLARNNPELFKSLLLESLRSQTAFGGRVWDALCKRKQTSRDKLKLDTSKWVSDSHVDTGEITLGVGTISKETAGRLIFEDWNFKGDKQYVYRTMHEISHLMGPKLHGVFNYAGKGGHAKTVTFTNALHNMRQGGLGMSPLGSMEFYKNKEPGTQAVEDYVELMNMYSIDPAYLKRYLLFLTDSKYKDFRVQNNLATLYKGTIDNIYDIIKSAMEFFLDGSNE